MFLKLYAKFCSLESKYNRKNVNIVKKKGRMTKIYPVNIERKRLLKQRRERTLQNTRGKRLAEEYFLTALKASHRSYKASKNSHKKRKMITGQSIMITQILQQLFTILTTLK